MRSDFDDGQRLLQTSRQAAGPPLQMYKCTAVQHTWLKLKPWDNMQLLGWESDELLVSSAMHDFDAMQLAIK